MESWSFIFDFLLSVHPLIYLFLIFIISIIENLFPPIPGDTLLVFSTYVFIINDYSITQLFIYSILGSIAGFMIIFGIGHHWGRDFFFNKNHKWMPVLFLRRVEKKFNKYGQWVIFLNRFMPGMRSVVGLFSGISKIPWGNALILVTVSTLMWNTLLMSTGYYLGENWEQIEQLIKEYNIAVSILFGSVILLWFVRRYLNFRNIRKLEI